jgi:hypothetical protein
MKTYLRNLVTTSSDSGNEFEGCSWKWWIHFIPTQIFPDRYILSKISFGFTLDLIKMRFWMWTSS